MATQDWQDTSQRGLDALQFLERLTVVTIGVFDSGVGGLSILDEALQQLPHHNYIYFADSANAPYGNRSPEWIAERSLQICRYLLEQNCSAIVVACNTATAEAIAAIRSTLDIPIIGVEPGIKPAAMQSINAPDIPPKRWVRSWIAPSAARSQVRHVGSSIHSVVKWIAPAAPAAAARRLTDSAVRPASPTNTRWASRPRPRIRAIASAHTSGALVGP